MVGFCILILSSSFQEGQKKRNANDFVEIYGMHPNSVKTDDDKQYVENWVRRRIELLQTPVDEVKINTEIARIIVELKILFATVPDKKENADSDFYRIRVLEERLLELRGEKNERYFEDDESRLEKAKELAEFYGFYSPIK